MVELWCNVPLDGYENLYKISDKGRVYSNRTKKILRDSLNKATGYRTIDLYHDKEHKTIAIHRLVALAFIPNPNNYPYVNHKDENKTNNHVDNLEWCTAKYNSNYGTAKQRLSESQRNNDTAKKVPIVVYKDNKFYKEYKSIRSVVRDLGFSRWKITSRLQSPDIYTNYIDNYVFSYKDETRKNDSSTFKVDAKTHGINDPHRTRTKEEMQERLSKIRPNLIIQDDYTKSHDKCHIYCTRHKLMFESTLHGILGTAKNNCPECSKESYREKASHNREYYQNKLDEHKLNTIVMGGDFTIGSEPCTMLCSHCNTSFTSTPTQLLNRYTGNGCKHCNKSHTMTIRNMKRYGHSEEEIKQALIEKGLNW